MGAVNLKEISDVEKKLGRFKVHIILLNAKIIKISVFVVMNWLTYILSGKQLIVQL